MKKKAIEPNIEFYSSSEECQIRNQFLEHFRKCPLADNELSSNLGLFLNSKNLSRILFMHYLYQQIIDVQGIIVEFGTRWGQNISLFSAIRGIYEPFNRHRKIVAFDTFEGFPKISDKDYDDCELIKKGGYSVTENYVEYLRKIMDFQEKDNPLSHIKKYEIRVGDACVEIDKYFEENPETVVALAFFDMDLYEPTKKCLEAIKPHLVKGSVLGFDEVNDHDCPGETIALTEVFGLNNISLKRYRYASKVSYFVVE